MKQHFVLAEEAADATFTDGSLADRLRELVLAMESQALVYGYSRVRKPIVRIMSDVCGRGPHLHAGFIAVDVGIETP